MAMTTDLGIADVDPAALPALPIVDAYQDWLRNEGVSVVRGFYIQDLKTMELSPWPRKGGQGAVLNLEGTGGINDAHVVEIAPGKASEPERHLYEEAVLILFGRGSTSVWYDGVPRQSFEWGPGSLFALPLNAWYQHFNGSGTAPARYVAVTNLPTVLNLFHSRHFVFNNPCSFLDRFSGEERYFSGEGTLFHRNRRNIWETNFVPDLHKLRLLPREGRGGGSTQVQLELTQNSMGAHVSQFPVGTYKKAHFHGPGAHVIILDGVGYSLLWKDRFEERTKCDWQPGTVVVPPERWFHQHYNTGSHPARYLALRFTGKKYSQHLGEHGRELTDLSVKQGGWQIEYEDEDPEVHRLFEAELAKHGAPCRMKAVTAGCTGEIGPTQIEGGED